MPNQFNASLWGDEAFSAVLSMNPIPKIIEIISRDTSPPLYNITEHLWFQIFGTSEVTVRSLSFLYFLLTVYFVYKIGTLLRTRRVGLLAAALTFLNPFFFVYAFEGRMYSILALGVTASMYFFLKILNSKNKKPKASDQVGYVVTTALALYSHHFSIFALFVQGIWFIKEFLTGNKQLAMKMFKSFIAVGIAYSPWLIPLYNQTRMVGGGFWLGTPTVADFFGLLGRYLGAGIPHSLQKIALALTLVAVLMRKWSRKLETDLFLLGWFLLPIALTWIVSQRFQSIFFDRYLLYTIPGAMLIVASKGRKFSGIVIGILVIVLLIIDFNYFTHPTKRPFRELATYVKETKQEKDLLINWNSAAHHLWESIYYEIPAPIYVPEGELPFYVGTAQMTDKDILKQIPKETERVGVITSGPIDEIELANYTEEEAKTFGELKFVWYQKRN
jgi:mannosyltransferase